MKKKICNVCGKLKLLSDFYKNIPSKDNHLNKCKVCFGCAIALIGIGVVIGRATRHKIRDEEFLVVRKKEIKDE